jgi:membrane-associated phospholipid phosphatase
LKSRRFISGGAGVVTALGLLAGSTVARAQDREGEIRYVGRSDPYEINPVTDVSIISLSLAFGAFSQIVMDTGEIVPQQPQDPGHLNHFDRMTVNQADPWAGPTSDILVLSAMGWALADPIATGVRDGAEPGVELGVLYAETLSLAWAAANTAKLIVRRPRPRAYQEQKRLYDLYGKENAPNISETEYSVSFFSGHVAFAAALASTATYHAFVRDPDHARPWITLGAGSILTTVVAVQRVRSGAHFPSDVVAGAFAGVGIGLLVPHLHRETKAVTATQPTAEQPLRASGPGFNFAGTF